ncbi:MAG: Tyrosine-tRNA ligase [candidate division CPR1 bacterium GW2011_GWC1_49_13]|uniref:Tyrosine--tRNA ligase n=1 Tax=candidate division CPR1 bacterium GW2011_GWC1_49_13 TaxID=1618342 RepID=A0A0G1VG90_9BACT|nr:MAG: Tyrosine-tRNA ligase [candidate division CPR1 bacterium GW2011_GWC1_49_13]
MKANQELLERRVAEVIEKEHLAKALDSGKKLKIKFGIDPTAPELHLGHTVPLLKLKEFQDLGHEIILIIGDATAEIGDPTGKSVARKKLTRKEVSENMKTYKRQIAKILDPKKTRFVYNSQWFKKMGLAQLMEMASTATLGQVQKRADFRKRLEAGGDVSVPEFIYPIMQGYDSLQIKADVEVGGTDQKFNLLMGRQVQKRFGQKEQDILTVPLLIGTDGVEKMSKTAGNFIALKEKPEEMFGKLMAIPDELIWSYFDLITNVSQEELKKVKEMVVRDPLAAKKALAREVVEMYWGEKEAQKAANAFAAAFSKGEVPQDAPTWNLAGQEADLSEILVEKGISKSKSAVRRLVAQGGVRLNGVKLRNWQTRLEPGILKVGKKTFIKIK